MNLFKPEPSAPLIPCIGLNADDAAKAIGISKKMLQAMVAAGEIPCAKQLGRKTQIFDPDELREWIKSKPAKKG